MSRLDRLPDLLLAAALAGALAAATAAPAWAVDLSFATENDFLTGDNRDDLYTYSIALAAERGRYRFALRENAFTDREAGARFDETHLTVRRDVPGLGPWLVAAEAGVVRVGRGIFGQDVQNALHRLLGDDELDLHYLDTRLHASLGIEAERWFELDGGLELGPRLEAASAPAFRSHAALGAQARWQPTPSIEVLAFAGGRWSDASLELLDRHLASLAPIARVGVVYRDGLFVSWTYNDYGDEREHLTIGLRLSGSRGGRRPASEAR